MEDNDAKADPLDLRLVPELLPSYLDELAKVEARRAGLDAQIKAATATEDDEGDGGSGDSEALSPAELAAFKRDLAAVKRQQKATGQEFITKLGKARADLPADQERDLVLGLARDDLSAHLDGYIIGQRRQIIVALETWWNKYAVPLRQIDAERAAAAAKLADFLRELGYER